MFANTQMMGMDLGFPDVCLTPIPVPTPIPYPNIAMAPMAVPNVTSVLIMGAPAHNLATSIPMTNGDNAGINMGVASGTVMGSSRHLTGAMTVLIDGMPATRLTSTSMQNGTNCPGVRIIPSQTLLLLLAP